MNNSNDGTKPKSTDAANGMGQSARARIKYRDFIISYFAQIFSASLLMMWSVMNLVHNFWAFVGMKNQPGNWTTVFLMVFLLGVVPFLISLFWLGKLLSMQSKK